MPLDTSAVRAAFPILERTMATDRGQRPLVYLDHGASTHAPTPVLNAVWDLMTRRYANIHRGLHTLSQESSDLFDASTAAFQRFLGAHKTSSIVLAQNTTTALDIAAHVMKDIPGRTLATRMEHHSNDLPHRRADGGRTAFADIDEDGRLRLDEIAARLDQGDIKLLAVTGASNVTGHTPPIHRLARMAHDAGARILVDAAQMAAHVPIDVKPPDHPEHIDFLAAAGHKSYAPFGGAFLHAPDELLAAAPPYLPGGGTVDLVTDDGALHNASPDRHMGGTPNLAGAVAFAAATSWLLGLGMQNVRRHEQELTEHALRRFAELEEDHAVVLLGPRSATDRLGVFSFLVPGQRHEEVSARLDRGWGIATRNGCFCAQPLMNRLLKIGDSDQYTARIARGEQVELPGATRATLGIYNTREEVDLLCDAVATIAREPASGREPAVGGTLEVP